MTNVPSAWLEFRCRAVATIDAADFPVLAVLMADVRAERGSLGCELVAGHDGLHVALAATAGGGDLWWWVRWNGQLREVVQIDPCSAELLQGSYRDGCML